MFLLRIFQKRRLHYHVAVVVVVMYFLYLKEDSIRKRQTEALEDSNRIFVYT